HPRHIHSFPTRRSSDLVQASRRAGAKSCAVHHDGIAFHFAVSVQMRAKTSVEYWIVFEDGDCGFNCIERVTAGNEYLPSRGESVDRKSTRLNSSHLVIS